MARFCALLCLVLGSAVLATAQLNPPAGWSVQNLGNAIVLNSPGNDPASRVALTLLPPGRPQGEVKSWFANQALGLAQAAGHPLGATEVIEQERILLRLVQLENQSHKKLPPSFTDTRLRRVFR